MDYEYRDLLLLTKKPWNTNNLTDEYPNNNKQLMKGNNFTAHCSWTDIHQID